jgi:subtilisin family serine protease
MAKTVFDDMLALLTPDRLLADPHATGRGVTVAIIDSGVERSVIEEQFATQQPPILPIEGAVFQTHREAPLPYTGQQSSPHGTTVAHIILSIAPQVKLYTADVFGSQGQCEVETLVAALRYAIDVWQAKVVNLSLGVPEHKLQQPARRNLLQRAIEEAYFQDVLVFAAAHNDHPYTRSYPAIFATPLVSVNKGLFASPLQFSYHLQSQVEFTAHSRGYLGPFAKEPATSWATPHLAGIAARLLSLKPNLKPFELKTLLYWLGQQHSLHATASSALG